MTPYVWTIDWQQMLPPSLAAYLTPADRFAVPAVALDRRSCWSGPRFGQLYARWGAAHLARYANKTLLLPGVVMLLGAAALRAWPPPVFGAGPGSVVPVEVLMRIGTCLLVLGAIAHLSRRITAAAAHLWRRCPGVAADLLRPPVHRLRVRLEPRTGAGLRRVADARADSPVRRPGHRVDGRAGVVLEPAGSTPPPGGLAGPPSLSAACCSIGYSDPLRTESAARAHGLRGCRAPRLRDGRQASRSRLAARSRRQKPEVAVLS